MTHFGPEVREAIDEGMKFLALNQLPYGEFPSYRYADRFLSGPGQFDSSPFVTTFALYALGFIGGAGAKKMIEKGIGFLLDEREREGTWRYWSSRNASTIDPDLDDACCASFVVRRLAPEAHFPGNRGLILDHRTERGLFKTWFRPPDAANDVDSIVNANVLLYLGEGDATRAACQALNRLVIEDREEGSYSYYLDTLALYYMISRAYFHGVAGLGACAEVVIRKTRARQRADGSLGDELLTGFGLCTLVNYGLGRSDEAERAAAFLIRSQNGDGGWPARAFYCGPEPPEPHSVWWGGEALTTSICMEGLVKLVNGGGQGVSD